MVREDAGGVTSPVLAVGPDHCYARPTHLLESLPYLTRFGHSTIVVGRGGQKTDNEARGHAADPARAGRTPAAWSTAPPAAPAPAAGVACSRARARARLPSPRAAPARPPSGPAGCSASGP